MRGNTYESNGAVVTAIGDFREERDKKLYKTGMAKIEDLWM